MNKINTATERARLPIRREPFWHTVAPGRAVGFRKMSESSPGAWIARYTNKGKEVRRSLPEVLDHGDAQRFGIACQLAQKWFEHMGAGGPAKPLTVREACEAYEDHLRSTKGEEAAEREARRFARLVYAQPWFADAEIESLTPPDFSRWRKSISVRKTAARNVKGTPLAPPTVARDITPVRAALNLAYSNQLVPSEQGWRKPLAAPRAEQTSPRRPYLPPEERRKLLEHLEELDARAFFEALSVLPLRPGALAAIEVGHYDRHLRVLTVVKDKKHAGREVQLPKTIAAIFERQAKGKLPGALLFGRTDGRPWTATTWRAPFRLAAAAAGLSKRASAYALRHSTISDLLLGGLDMNSVAVLAGTSATMLGKHYFHLHADRSTEALEKLSRL
jgi:integrase